MNDAASARIQGALRTMVDFDCPHCEASAAVQRVEAHQITCGRCSASRPFQRGEPYVLTGSPGTGKSTVGRLLAARLSLEWVVLDTDLTARPEHDETEQAWLGFIDTWLRTAVGVAQGGHGLVLVGYSAPHQWDLQPLRHFLGPITYLALTCSDEELDARLTRRTWMGSPHERKSLLELNRHFRERDDVVAIETDHLSPEAIAERIEALITSPAGS